MSAHLLNFVLRSRRRVEHRQAEEGVIDVEVEALQVRRRALEESPTRSWVLMRRGFEYWRAAK